MARPRPRLRRRRANLVEGWAARATQAAAIQFLDPMLVLPARLVRAVAAPGAVPRAALGRARRAVRGVAVFAQRAAPAVRPAWLILVTAYSALVPFGAQLAELHHRGGLRRWLSTTDRTARIVHAGVLTVLGPLWTAAASPTVEALAVVVSLAVAAVVRTAANRRPGTTTWARSVPQPVRGPDVAVLGTLLAEMGTGVAALVPIVVVPIAWASCADGCPQPVDKAVHSLCMAVVTP